MVSAMTAEQRGTNNGNNKVVTQSQINNILKSKEFQDTLATIVAPQVAKQVNDLIQPSVEKLDTIETQVKELHNYVDDNKKWQTQQSNRQTDFQTNMNSMATSMYAMGGKIDTLVDLFQSNSIEDEGNLTGKRTVDNISTEQKHGINHRKTKHRHKEDITVTQQTNTAPNTQVGMTSPLHPLHIEPHPPESDEEMLSSPERFEGAGKEQ
jgi:hypothetical protein